MRYGRLAEDLSITPDRHQEKLFYQRRSRFGDENALLSENAKNWFNDVAPPDLSLISRLHSVDWLYAYMRGFYRDPARPSG